MRNYPALHACYVYDPRYRPWYVSASSGSKDIIFLIDSSDNLSSERFKTMTEIVSFILSTLTFNDYVGMVNIGNDELLFSPYLLRANYAGTKYMKNFIQKIVAKGEANLEKSLTKLYDILDRSYDSERSTNCNTFVFYMSGGVPSQGITDNKLLYELIMKREAVIEERKRPKFFSYTLGEQPLEINFPYYLSCNKDGIYENIDLKNYYPSFLSYFQSIGLTSVESKLIYAEPYYDTAGAGYVTTAAMSVYDRTLDPPFRIGVIGIDLKMNDLLKIGTIDEAFLAFKDQGKLDCKLFSISQCQIESLRPNKYKCANYKHLLKEKFFSGCNSIQTNVPLCSEGIKEKGIC
jgi:hypothetical protein